MRFSFILRYMKGVFALFFALGILLLCGTVVAPQTHAAALGSVSDQITTSRPSAASPLTSNASPGTGQLSIVNNGSRYLASDSAYIINGAGTITNSGLNVASQSSVLTTVYLGNTTSTFAGASADTLVVPIVATHTINFHTVAGVPSSGHIVVNFPNSSSNTASPSANAFNWNSLSSSNVSVTGATCGSINVSTPGIVDCTLGSPLAGNTQVTMVIGSSSPVLVNPTKTASAGNADTWKITISTKDASNNILDSSSTKIGIVEAIQVLGTIEPTLTFTITGVGDNVNINGISSSCGSISTNSGVGSTPTTVNLGILGNGYINASAQQLSVSTNSSTGYVITATSSGRFINPASGVFLPDANGGSGLTSNDHPVPGTITAGTPAFGIHACGADSNINGDQWTNNGTLSGSAKFSNPWNTGTNTYYNTIASNTSGPVTNALSVVLYAATVSGTTPAGLYSTALTYVATATF
jgi:hypothetical protein